jgi:hypothetical protein
MKCTSKYCVLDKSKSREKYGLLDDGRNLGIRKPGFDIDCDRSGHTRKKKK